MENEDIETAETLEGIGDTGLSAATKPGFSFSWEAKAEKIPAEETEDRATEALAKADEHTCPQIETLTSLPDATSVATKAGLVDALSLTIDALQEVFAELTDAKVETLAVAKRATEKATRAGIELDLSLLDDPFDEALRDVERLLNTLEKQRNRARMATSA